MKTEEGDNLRPASSFKV